MTGVLMAMNSSGCIGSPGFLWCGFRQRDRTPLRGRSIRKGHFISLDHFTSVGRDHFTRVGHRLVSDHLIGGGHRFINPYDSICDHLISGHFISVGWNFLLAECQAVGLVTRRNREDDLRRRWGRGFHSGSGENTHSSEANDRNRHGSDHLVVSRPKKGTTIKIKLAENEATIAACG